MKDNYLPFLFEQWLIDKKGLAESTVYVYRHCVQTYLLNNPNTNDLESYNRFIIEHAVKKRSNHYYSALKNFIEFHVEDKATRTQLIEGLILPPIRKNYIRERRYLSETQIFNVINSLKHEKHRVIALIQTLTGIRAGDILRLKKPDGIMPEKYDNKEVLRLNVIGKGQKRIVVFIHDVIGQQVIMKYITNNHNHDNYYFLELSRIPHRRQNISNENKLLKMNYMRYWHDLKSALYSNKIQHKDFSTHDFRRCFARRAWEKFKDIHVLQGLLNHSNPATTLRYLEQSGMKNIDYLYEMQQ